MGNTVLDQTDDQFQDLFRVLLFDEVEVIQRVGRRLEVRENPLVDLVGLDDDGTLFGLGEYLIQRDNGDHPGVDDVPEYVPRADRKLIHVPYQDQGKQERGKNLTGMTKVVRGQGNQVFRKNVL